MSLAITPAILDTILGHLAPHFIEAANGDLPTARHAASRMLASLDAQTEEELHLATDIVGFGFHALEALSAAAAPDLSLNQKIRLRGSAVSLSREAHKARRKLEQLKRARLTGSPRRQPALEIPQPEDKSRTDLSPTDSPTPADLPPADLPPADLPQAELPSDLIKFAKRALQAATSPGGINAWGMAHKRQAAERITENLQRNKAEHERRQAAIVIPPVQEQTPSQPARA